MTRRWALLFALGLALRLGLLSAWGTFDTEVQKAWAAGFAAVVAVSAPTSLAVQAARRAGLGLVGFVREDGYNLYSP